MTNLETALQYHARGLSVIPLWSPAEVSKNPDAKYNPALTEALAKNSSSKNPWPETDVKRKVLTGVCKEPLVYSWKEYQKRLPTNDEITRWFTDYPEANIGIVTGAVSGVIVVDIDTEEVFERLKTMNGVPETPMAKSGKGYHLYIKHPGFKVGCKANTKIKIDVRGDGGLIVAPPSVHGTGRQYEWVQGHSIYDLEPAQCLPWMFDYFNGKSPFEPDRPESLQSGPAPNVDNDIGGPSDILAAACYEGERNQIATRLIGHLLGKGLEPDAVWLMVCMWNRDKCVPPISEQELHKTFASICRLESESRPKQSQVDITAFLDTPDAIATDYLYSHVCIPFGGDNLQGLQGQMNGGLQGSNVYYLGGIPSSCKTGLANNMADNVCLDGYPVLFFSYDDTRAEIRNRTFARFSRYCINQFNRRDLPETAIRAITDQPDVKELLSRKYVIDVVIPVERWRDLIVKVQEAHSKPPVVIIDYLKKLRSSRRTSDERLRIEDIVMKLSVLAKEFNIPIIVISELARESYKAGQKLGMASFKESGSIEYEASWLGILAAVEEKDGQFVLADNWERIIENDGYVDLIVFKAKRGTGSTGRVPLKINRDKMLVSDRPSATVYAMKSDKKKKSQFKP